MYSDKEQVNILTALLAEHDVQHAVACPGSRNAPIVHNLNEHPAIALHAVTDERSAGFYALGMALALDAPVAVCVTSGSALLNLLPAVAEAYYQQVPLVVVSADRPARWIGQLDGQTMPQPDALGRFARLAVSLPEVRDDENRWHCNRLVNEALLATRHHGCGPVHINVPISEPLYTFTVQELPRQRCITRVQPSPFPTEAVAELSRHLHEAERPMIVVGQCRGKVDAWQPFPLGGALLHEALSPLGEPPRIDEALAMMREDEAETYRPDVLVYMGGTIVNKRLKAFLRECKPREVWLVREDGLVADVTMSVTHIIEANPMEVLNELTSRPIGKWQPWHKLLATAREQVLAAAPANLADWAVRHFEENLPQGGASLLATHYANSTSIRLGNRYARHHVYCNRGINGIEGSLSTAAGHSLVTDGLVFCVIGDLSFFYDQNALWPNALRGNLRILLLNNGGGAIFNRFAGLRQSAAREPFVMACHDTTARGICQSYRIGYHAAHNKSEVEAGLAWLMGEQAGDRPLLLEVMA